ncbi:MAG TPA: hypothetical protein VNS34_10490 [Rhizobiaceae bacterium]|nr:hypothetical protein [Rhizobiaceae bacterium]
MTEEQIEAGAFALYREFISVNGQLSTRQRVLNGKPLYLGDRPVFESIDEAAARRWMTSVPETQKARWRREAIACFGAMEMHHAA